MLPATDEVSLLEMIFFRRYEGLIGNNTMHGQGTYVWPNRDRYRGEYHKGLRNGMGEMIYYAKKEKYMGHWQDGLYHGQGQYWYTNH